MKMKLIIFLCCTIVLFSCRKPEDTPAPSSIIRGKKWKLISYLVKNPNDVNYTEIISGFSGCTISFNNDGGLVITNAGKSNTGSWTEFSEPPKIEMDVISNDSYVNLFNKTWEAVLLNPSRIQLADSKINPQEKIKLDVIP